MIRPVRLIFAGAMRLGLFLALITIVPSLARAEQKGGEDPIASADLNTASLRVTALDALYQFDFSDAQLKAIAAAAAGAADPQVRAPGAGDEKLRKALIDLEEAILASKEDATIAKLRAAVVELVNSEGVQLNDEVKMTDAARTRTPDVFKRLTSTQIAAYIAGHAHEVGDPVELFTAALDDLRDLHADAVGGKEPRAGARATGMIQDTGNDIGHLVGGLDEVKVRNIAGQISAKLQTAYEMKDAEFVTQRPRLEEEAAKIVADATSMQVLTNWIQLQIAMLISNPQLPQMVESLEKARAAGRGAELPGK